MHVRHQIEWIEHDMRRTVAKGLLEANDDLPPVPHETTEEIGIRHLDASLSRASRLIAAVGIESDH